MKKVLSLWILLSVCAAILVLRGAAFGGDVDYSGGGDSGGYSGGDSYYDYGSGGSGSSRGSGYLALGVGAVWLVASVVKNKPWQKGGGKPQNPKRDPESLSRLQEQDPSFDGEAVKRTVKQWVYDFEKAWCEGTMAPCRENIVLNQYDRYQQQLSEMAEQRQAAVTEGLTIHNVVVERWHTGKNNDYLDVWIDQQKRTYVVSARNRSCIVKGDRDTTYRLYYRWKLSRPAGSTNAWQLHSVTKLGQLNW
ncbi:MAG: TIM44-like domain-containing protein [Oscillospiraceae bacterium]